MQIDKKAEVAMSKILASVFGKGSVNIYQEIAVEGLSHEKVRMVEAPANIRSLDKISPFSKIVKQRVFEKNADIKNLHSKVMDDLRNNKKTSLDEKTFNKIMSSNGVIKKISLLITDALNTSGVEHTPEKVRKVSIIAKKSRDTELAKSYLMLKNTKFISPQVHVLAKGIKNLENPESNEFIPSDLIKETGMVQIGLALNNIATTGYGEKIGDLNEKGSVNLKRLSQSGGSNSTTFTNMCKKLARDWEIKHMDQLLKLIEKQDNKIKDENGNELNKNKDVITKIESSAEKIGIEKASSLVENMDLKAASELSKEIEAGLIGKKEKNARENKRVRRSN